MTKMEFIYRFSSLLARQSSLCDTHSLRYFDIFLAPIFFLVRKPKKKNNTESEERKLLRWIIYLMKVRRWRKWEKFVTWYAWWSKVTSGNCCCLYSCYIFSLSLSLSCAFRKVSSHSSRMCDILWQTRLSTKIRMRCCRCWWSLLLHFTGHRTIKALTRSRLVCRIWKQHIWMVIDRRRLGQVDVTCHKISLISYKISGGHVRVVWCLAMMMNNIWNVSKISLASSHLMEWKKKPRTNT